MLGYDISWAGFNIIEVMSSPKFTHKRIGYLAAAQCFHADSEVNHNMHKFSYPHHIFSTYFLIISKYFEFFWCLELLILQKKIKFLLIVTHARHKHDTKGLELPKSV